MAELDLYKASKMFTDRIYHKKYVGKIKYTYNNLFPNSGKKRLEKENF